MPLTLDYQAPEWKVISTRPQFFAAVCKRGALGVSPLLILFVCYECFLTCAGVAFRASDDVGAPIGSHVSTLFNLTLSYRERLLLIKRQFLANP